jgi:N-acetylglucosamine kinase-like BadF-type ATPase
MKRYFLGADVGATKTHVLITDETGVLIGFGESGPGNHEVVGYNGLQQALLAASTQALAAGRISTEMITGAGFGVAGYDWPSEKEATLQAIQALGLSSPLEVTNDTILGLMAGSPHGWGIAVVSGTGCNCRGWGRNHDREGRVVGRSLLVGEGAGGTELIAKVVEAMAYEWTLRGPHTELTPVMIKYLGANSLTDLLEGISQGYYDLNASAAPLVFQVAASGDPVALGILQWAGRELGEMANAVIRQLGFEGLEFDVVLIGSMFEGGSLLIEPMQQTIHSLAPEARLLRLTVTPVIGAVLLGMQAAGFRPSARIHKTLSMVRI